MNPINNQSHNVANRIMEMVTVQSIKTTAADSDIREELQSMIIKDRKKLKEWLQVPNSTEDDFGGMEGLSLVIINVLRDRDNDGILTESEVNEAKEKDEKTVSQFLEMLGTCGVVGALLFSGIFTFITNPLVASDESSSFFGNSLTSMKYLYYSCLSFALVLSGVILYYSFSLYQQLSLWMPTTELQMWYIREISITPLIQSCVANVGITLLGLSCGVSINISPTAGLITFIMVLMGTIVIILGTRALKNASLSRLKKVARLLVV